MMFAGDEKRLHDHVRLLPCLRVECPGGCGRVEVSHSDQQRDGKGMGIKAVRLWVALEQIGGVHGHGAVQKDGQAMWNVTLFFHHRDGV